MHIILMKFWYLQMYSYCTFPINVGADETDGDDAVGYSIRPEPRKEIVSPLGYVFYTTIPLGKSSKALCFLGTTS